MWRSCRCIKGKKHVCWTDSWEPSLSETKKQERFRETFSLNDWTHDKEESISYSWYNRGRDGSSPYNHQGIMPTTNLYSAALGAPWTKLLKVGTYFMKTTCWTWRYSLLACWTKLLKVGTKILQWGKHSVLRILVFDDIICKFFLQGVFVYTCLPQSVTDVIKFAVALSHCAADRIDARLCTVT